MALINVYPQISEMHATMFSNTLHSFNSVPLERSLKMFQIFYELGGSSEGELLNFFEPSCSYLAREPYFF